MKKKNIIIVNSRNIFGGTIVLSLLSKLLNDRGFNAKVLYVHDFPTINTIEWKFWIKWLVYSIKYRLKLLLYKIFYNTRFRKISIFSCFDYIPIQNVKEKYTPFFRKENTIVIYPEVVSGNFLKAKNVVRWLLYHHNWEGKNNAYNPHDLFICYRQIFNDWNLNPDGNELQLNFFDAEMYRQYNYNERKGNCYILRKGRRREDLPKEFDGPVIDFGMSERDVVRIFNTCKYCYSYDTQTFYTQLAAVCGCIPIVILEPGKTKADYLTKSEMSMKGVAYGNSHEEIARAIATRNDLIETLDYSKLNDINISNFIELLEKRFNWVI